MKRFWDKVDIKGPNDCWVWTAGRQGDYGCFKLDGLPEYAHRVAWLLTKGDIPNGWYVCHDCPNGNNKLCCNPNHLWLGTHRDNIQDAYDRGELPVFVTKLDGWKRCGICALYLMGWTARELASQYSVATCSIHRVLNENLHAF